MDRRRFLFVVATGVSTSPGCVALDDRSPLRGDRNTGTSARTNSTATPSDDPGPTPDPDDPIRIVFGNDVTGTVTVTVRDGDETLLDATESLGAGSRAFDSGIGTTGTYELSVAFADGPAATVDLPVTEYDVRSGSDVLVAIDEGGVEFYVED